jgi:hypothetical protein
MTEIHRGVICALLLAAARGWRMGTISDVALYPTLDL